MKYIDTNEGGRIKDLTGMRFKKLVAIKPLPLEKRNQDGSVLWLCKCDCGNYVKVYTKGLIKGRLSCGCAGKPALPRGEAAMNQVLRGYIKGSEKRGLEFSLTRDQFKIITQRRCYYCGKPPSTKANYPYAYATGDYIYNGIDRIDNNNGYTNLNVLACCEKCNKCKWDTEFYAFLRHVLAINNHFKNSPAFSSLINV